MWAEREHWQYSCWWEWILSFISYKLSFDSSPHYPYVLKEYQRHTITSESVNFTESLWHFVCGTAQKVYHFVMSSKNEVTSKNHVLQIFAHLFIFILWEQLWVFFQSCLLSLQVNVCEFMWDCRLIRQQSSCQFRTTLSTPKWAQDFVMEFQMRILKCTATYITKRI